MKADVKKSPATNIAEPSVGFAPVPVVIFLLVGVLFYLGQLYLDHYGGGFNAKVYQPYDSWAQVEDLQPKDETQKAFNNGRKSFKLACEGCHQSTGLGQPGIYPPLAGSDWVLAEGPNRIIRIAEQGLQGPVKIKGADWNAAMSFGLGASFSDKELADLLTYVRGNKEWGNNATRVTPEQVRAVRDQIKGRETQWTSEELLAIPDK